MTSTHPGLADGPAYLDYNATTPVDPGVLEAMLPFLSTEFGNPSSTHGYGLRARSALEQAREQVRGLVSGGGRAVFTGSGSEADALAIRGAVLARVTAGLQRPHVITQVTEHPAVLAACQHLERYHGVRVTYLGVDRFGRVEPESVRESLTPDTVLVSVMQANNETGTIQPVQAIAEITREHGVLLHCDAAQSVGKLVVEADALGVDLLTIVGHKMYAPKGIAALWIREGVDLTPIVGGGGQEGAFRAGTENVAFAVGLGAAADLAADALAVGEAERLRELRDRLHAGLERRLPGRVRLNGHPTERLPNTLNIGVDGVRALTLLELATGIAASTGSACHAGHDEPSPVLSAMGIPAPEALASIRLSLGRWTTPDDIALATAMIAEHSRPMSGPTPSGTSSPTA